MKKLVLFMVMLFGGTVLFAQEKSKSKEPDQKISVNKEFDEKGNLIRYDSSIVRSWSADTTMSIADMESIHREMGKFMKGDNFSYFFGDSVDFANDAFREFHKDFFDRWQDIPDSAFNRNDTTGMQIPDMQFPFADFDKMQEEMMKQFGQFFQSDSIKPENENFNFFFDPDEFDNLKKEFEKYFNQYKELHLRKMSASDDPDNAEVPL